MTRDFYADPGTISVIKRLWFPQTMEKVDFERKVEAERKAELRDQKAMG